MTHNGNYAYFIFHHAVNTRVVFITFPANCESRLISKTTNPFEALLTARPSPPAFALIVIFDRRM